MVLDVAGVAQLVRDVARCHERIAWSENEGLVTDNNFQFSYENKVGFVLARMRMTRHTHSRC